MYYTQYIIYFILVKFKRPEGNFPKKKKKWYSEHDETFNIDTGGRPMRNGKCK